MIPIRMIEETKMMPSEKIFEKDSIFLSVPSVDFVMNLHARIFDLGLLIDDILLFSRGQILDVDIFVGIDGSGTEDEEEGGQSVHDVVSDGGVVLYEGAIVTHLERLVHNYFVTRRYISDF